MLHGIGMPDYKRYPNEGFPYFVTTNVRDRQPLFTDHACCQIVIDSIMSLRTRLGHQVHAYVLMLDYIHLVITPRENAEVSQAMHSLKLYTSRQVGALLGRKGGI